MRDNFTFEREPDCPLCHSPMEPGERMLPRLHNTNEPEG
jgi:hypothetical protein